MPSFRLHPAAHSGRCGGLGLTNGGGGGGVGEENGLDIQNHEELPPAEELKAEEQKGRELEGGISSSSPRRRWSPTSREQYKMKKKMDPYRGTAGYRRVLWPRW